MLVLLTHISDAGLCKSMKHILRDVESVWVTMGIHLIHSEKCVEGDYSAVVIVFEG